MERPDKTGNFKTVGQSLGGTRDPLLIEAAKRAQSIAPIHSLWITIDQDPLFLHTRPTALTDGTLTVAADSPVWANQLRHRLASVLERLKNSGFSTIRHIRIRIQPVQSHLDNKGPRASDPDPVDRKTRDRLNELRRALD